jgi:hypothetical protein
MYYGVQLLHMSLTWQNAGFIPCHVEYIHKIPYHTKRNADHSVDLAELSEMKFQVVSRLFSLIYWSYAAWPHSKFPFSMEIEH